MHGGARCCSLFVTALDVIGSTKRYKVAGGTAGCQTRAAEEGEKAQEPGGKGSPVHVLLASCRKPWRQDGRGSQAPWRAGALPEAGGGGIAGRWFASETMAEVGTVPRPVGGRVLRGMLHTVAPASSSGAQFFLKLTPLLSASSCRRFAVCRLRAVTAIHLTLACSVPAQPF
ncbi:hypothetical protein TREES_T100015888 [Tupaia chinensis]|uniref:Uncharacterized protein n=1 Tax=Tupaia chinensis TaxID=246437 RepID=L9KX15_TUPCH|nr:hypothetical protein TREES_T100015888 [Tupaia chinensis]